MSYYLPSELPVVSSLHRNKHCSSPPCCEASEDTLAASSYKFCNKRCIWDNKNGMVYSLEYTEGVLDATQCKSLLHCHYVLHYPSSLLNSNVQTMPYVITLMWSEVITVQVFKQWGIFTLVPQWGHWFSPSRKYPEHVGCLWLQSDTAISLASTDECKALSNWVWSVTETKFLVLRHQCCHLLCFIFRSLRIYFKINAFIAYCCKSINLCSVCITNGLSTKLGCVSPLTLSKVWDCSEYICSPEWHITRIL
jgi:hypothetical protein